MLNPLKWLHVPTEISLKDQQKHPCSITHSSVQEGNFVGQMQVNMVSVATSTEHNVCIYVVT